MDLIGPELASEFWDGWHKNYVNKNDIDAIADWGFNSLRIPFHYKQFSESLGTINPYGYEIVDSMFTPSFADLPSKNWKAMIIRLPRLILFKLSPKLLSTFLGGISMMVLAK